jgi:hypothetical protein
VIHSAVHAARPDAHCVLHTHDGRGRGGLGAEERPAADLAAASVVLASLGYHDYEGIALLDAEKPRLQRDSATTLPDPEEPRLLTVAGRWRQPSSTCSCCSAPANTGARTGGGELVSVDARIVQGVKPTSQR